MGEKKSYIVLSFDLNLQDNLEQTVTTPSTQLEKSTKNDQQTKGKKKKKKKNKAQSKAQSEEQYFYCKQFLFFKIVTVVGGMHLRNNRGF